MARCTCGTPIVDPPAWELPAFAENLSYKHDQKCKSASALSVFCQAWLEAFGSCFAGPVQTTACVIIVGEGRTRHWLVSAGKGSECADPSPPAS